VVGLAAGRHAEPLRDHLGQILKIFSQKMTKKITITTGTDVTILKIFSQKMTKKITITTGSF
jgi:hypothetical protein